MKALSVRQPWSWLLAAGYKEIENRSWHTQVRGTILIHAGKTAEDPEYPQRLMQNQIASAPKDKELEAYVEQIQAINRYRTAYENPAMRGAIIGAAEIVDCLHESDSLWYQGPHGFLLRNPHLFEAPVPWSGRLGFFEVDTDLFIDLRANVSA